MDPNITANQLIAQAFLFKFLILFNNHILTKLGDFNNSKSQAFIGCKKKRWIKESNMLPTL